MAKLGGSSVGIGVVAGIVAAIISMLLPSPPTIRMMWTEKPNLRPWIVGSFIAAGALIAVLLSVNSE